MKTNEKIDYEDHRGNSDEHRDGDSEIKTPGINHFFRIFTFMSRADTLFNVGGCICAIGAGVTQPLVAVVFGSFIDKFTNFGSGRLEASRFRNDLNDFTLWFVYLFVVKLVLMYGSGMIFTTTALRTTKNIRSAFVQAVLRQDVSYIDVLGSGAVAVKATTNANQINAGISSKLAHVIQSISMIIAALVVGCMQSWKLMLIITAVVVPCFIVLPLTMTGEANIDARTLQIYSRASNLAEEMLGSIKTVHAFGAGKMLLRRFDQWLLDASKVGQKKGPILAIMYGADFFFSNMPYSVAFWQGTKMYVAGDVDNVGSLWIIVFAVLMMASGLAQIAPSISAFVQASVAAAEIFEVFDHQPSLDTTSKVGEKPVSVVGDLAFHNVDFSYPSRPGVQVLNGIFFSCPAKKVTALVGASGSGKSTIISLLERWYKPSHGHITLDGMGIETLNLQWLRTQLRLVQQEPVLFNDTIFNNVIQGLTGTEYEHADRGTKQKLVVQACTSANAARFIESLPEGYETNVGERASLLSGGQKQRIAIARSIISNPPILLLDEATSALDAKSEVIVQAALNNASKSRTTLIIAHKLSTIMNADKIIVIDRGEVVEQGTHRELLHRDGRYATLVKAQGLRLSGTEASKRIQDITETEKAHKVVAEIEDTPPKLENKSLSVSEDQSTQGSRHSIMRIFWTFVLENGHLWPHYATCVTVSIIGGAVYPAQAIILTRLITAFELPVAELQTRVKFYAGMLFLVACVSMIAYAIMGWVTNVISQTLIRRYRLELLSSMLHQDVAFFDRPENAAATLASRLSTDPNGLQELLGMNMTFILVIVVNLVSCVALALAYGWKLGLVITSTLPLIFGSGIVRLRLEMTADKRDAAVFADSSRFASQAVAAMRTVVSFCIQQTIWTEYDRTLEALLRKSYATVSWSMLSYALAESIQFPIMGLAFWYGGRLLADGQYSTEQFYVIYLAVIFGGEAAGQFFAYTPNISKAVAGAEFILKLRHSKAAIADDPKAKSPDASGGYEFQNVDFQYPLRKDVSVLQGLDLKIKPSTSVAFVGGSGCGKSTTIGLLERYYDPTNGTIDFSKTPLPDLRLATYRSNLALVSQEPTLYQGSIADNIALGKDNASVGEIEQAAKDAHILGFITSLPEGMNTDCGSRGTELSGGQKQRICIARALIRDPKVLLLDEATSALDSTSERLVQEALKDVVGGRIVVFVAHRLATIRDCDQIFVLENGRVAESGTHEELLALGSSYKKLCEAQSLG